MKTLGSMAMPSNFKYRRVHQEGRPQHAEYSDFWRRHMPMDPARRAKIFTAFDALRGFDDMIATAESVHTEYVESQSMPGKETEDGLMCTRYYVELSPELRPYIEAANHSPLKEKMVSTLGKAFNPEGEIRPTDMAAVIAPASDGTRRVFPMIWGYHISGIDHPIVNARVESAKYKKSFSEDWWRHRCIVPASYYFEWQHSETADGKQRRGTRFAIQPRDSGVTWIAGLYRLEEDRGLKYPVFTILTRTPSEELLQIHDRMPLILPESAIDRWINPASNPEEIIGTSLTDMVFVPAETTSDITAREPAGSTDGLFTAQRRI